MRSILYDVQFTLALAICSQFPCQSLAILHRYEHVLRAVYYESVVVTREGLICIVEEDPSVLRDDSSVGSAEAESEFHQLLVFLAMGSDPKGSEVDLKHPLYDLFSIFVGVVVEERLENLIWIEREAEEKRGNHWQG